MDGSSVLIVERSDDVRQVLRTALARRGVQVHETSAAESAVDLARLYRPDVIVLDVDDLPNDASWTSGDPTGSARFEQTAVILLGTMRHGGLNNRDFIAKPYHYEQLISRIEQLLHARVGRGAARADRRAG